eukprot:TRINITY_DN3459_c0_g1_i2.p1 TRINITY_DN3459_c0_g1~~TRINITY_DN3459_c0_g1_i2.p1  ORF type:complete len:263 (-),score=61.78 TRINITY_DN3459_c0_g1_i2:50-838(-)
MNGTKAALAVFVVLGLFIITAEAHGYLQFPVARTGTGDNVRTVPCGGKNAAAVPKGNYFVKGRVSTITWKIVADHGGTVRLFMDYEGGSNFTPLSPIVPNKSPASYNVIFDDTCNPCSLQWLWTTSSESSPYVGCADFIVLDATKNITLILDEDFATFTSANKASLKKSLAVLAEVKEAQIKIYSYTSGSVVVVFTIDYDYGNVKADPDNQIDVLTSNIKNEDKRKAANFTFKYKVVFVDSSASGPTMGVSQNWLSQLVSLF